MRRTIGTDCPYRAWFTRCSSRREVDTLQPEDNRHGAKAPVGNANQVARPCTRVPSGKQSSPRAARHSGPARHSGRRVPIVYVALLALLSGLLVPVIAAATSVTAADATYVFLVNSTAHQGASAAAISQRVCESTAGGNPCTLRAAIEVANSIPEGSGTVFIGLDPQWSGNRHMAVPTGASRMMTTSPQVSWDGSPASRNFGDNGAAFVLNRQMTIDLEHRLTINNGTSDAAALQSALFFINGPDVTLTRFRDTWSAETSFYVGPRARRTVIDQAHVQTLNWAPERFILIRGGAEDVTVSNSIISGFASDGAASRRWTWGVVEATNAAWPVRGTITLSGNHFRAAYGGTARCNGTQANGCASTPLLAEGQHVEDVVFVDNRMDFTNRVARGDARGLDFRGAHVRSVTVRGNLFYRPFYMNTVALIDFGHTQATGATVGGTDPVTGAPVGGIWIQDNEFIGLSGSGTANLGAVIQLPHNRSIPAGEISGNTITADSSLRANAIFWSGSQTSAAAPGNITASNLRIVDNHFQDFNSANRTTIRLVNTGAVEVRGNTFGVPSGSQANTVHEEWLPAGNNAEGITLFNNANTSANGKMNTWFPTGRNAQNQQSAPLQAQGCVVEMEIGHPVTAPQGARPLTAPGTHNPGGLAQVDVYWTASNNAEVLLESGIHVPASGAVTIFVELPAPGDPRLAGNGGVGPVHPVTGVVSGGLRLQTHDLVGRATGPGTVENVWVSSQFSRVVSISGTCNPEISVNQAEAQHDPTMVRDLHFVMTSSIELDVNSALDPDNYILSVHPTEQTTVWPGDSELPAQLAAQQVARINARIIEITELPGSQGRVFEVIVRVDDSARVELAVPAGVMRTASGHFSNSQPSQSFDNEVTFVNPLFVDFEVTNMVTGQPDGRDYSINIHPAAPAPLDNLYFASQVIDFDGGADVVLSQPQLTISPGFRQAVSNARLNAGQISAGSPVFITHTVASTDAIFDGLIVPVMRINRFSVDPQLGIVKEAWIPLEDEDSGQFLPFDQSSIDSVMATGQLAPAGGRVLDRTPVCFIYTVTNNSADDWNTVMRDVEIIDSDARVNTDLSTGSPLVGVIPELAVGESAQLMVCTVILDVDTTATSQIPEEG